MFCILLFVLSIINSYGQQQNDSFCIDNYKIAADFLSNNNELYKSYLFLLGKKDTNKSMLKEYMNESGVFNLKISDKMYPKTLANQAMCCKECTVHNKSDTMNKVMSLSKLSTDINSKFLVYFLQSENEYLECKIVFNDGLYDESDFPEIIKWGAVVTVQFCTHLKKIYSFKIENMNSQ